MENILLTLDTETLHRGFLISWNSVMQNCLSWIGLYTREIQRTDKRVIFSKIYSKTL